MRDVNTRVVVTKKIGKRKDNKLTFVWNRFRKDCCDALLPLVEERQTYWQNFQLECDVSVNILLGIFHQRNRVHFSPASGPKMSTVSRVRKTSPVKQGPMRATIPVASLLRHSAGLQKSPRRSPTAVWKAHASGQRSPGSKEQSKVSNGGIVPGNIIRRTASLDTIYLKGQWPRDSFYLHSGLLQVDKATQTEDPSAVFKTHRFQGDSAASSPVSSDDKFEKLFRQRLQQQRSKDAGDKTPTAPAYLVHQTSFGECSTSSQTVGGISPSVLLSPTAKATPMNIPIVKQPIIKPPMRNSVEALNQEIERLVLKGGLQSFDRMLDHDKFQQATPEGHRAPVADLLRATRSVNTQTPAASDITSSCQSSGPSSRNSSSPLIPGHLDVSRSNSDQGNSQDGSPASPLDANLSPDNEPSLLGTSPHINRFLAREPPDGCERAISATHSQRARGVVDFSAFEYCALKPTTFQLRPSVRSAFEPLQPVHAAAAGGAEEVYTKRCSGSVPEASDSTDAMPKVPQPDTL